MSDNDEETETLLIAQGIDIKEEPKEHDWPIAQLWVPNPEYASGWESVRIDRKKPKKNGKRKMGFK